MVSDITYGFRRRNEWQIREMSGKFEKWVAKYYYLFKYTFYTILSTLFTLYYLHFLHYIIYTFYTILYTLFTLILHYIIYTFYTNFTLQITPRVFTLQITPRVFTLRDITGCSTTQIAWTKIIQLHLQKFGYSFGKWALKL